MASSSTIPIIDVAGLRRGTSGELARVSDALRAALENIGFYYLTGHGIPTDLVQNTFGACQAFHALPLEQKLAIRMNEHLVGYLPVNGYISKSSRIEQARKPNFVEAFFAKREVASGADTDTRLYRAPNLWPPQALLPSFKQSVVDYCAAMEALCLMMLPAYAQALEMDADFFAPAFVDAQFTLRMSHYPPADRGEDDQYGVAPHTDSSFLTMLAQPDLPGLSIRLESGEWIEAPVVPDSFIVNSGDLLRRWTNHRFLSTPHRVINSNIDDRYAIPFFYDANVDYPMECISSCCPPDNPARYEPTTYVEYMRWFAAQYAADDNQNTTTVEDPAPALAN
ncbi:MAG: isopenicillin N synthase family oxygenase [Chromatiales bacterium]|jgi:isopenicillin N synthase-like dioxygenase|nr:isopenicillin N synthase family oxygenase [Chromatiales bacterium]